MADQKREAKLVLSAEDKATRTLRKLGDRLRDLSRRSGLTRLARQVRRVARAFRPMAGAALGAVKAMGALAGITGGLSFAGLLAGMKAFAEETDGLVKQARLIGITAQQLRDLQYVGGLIGVSQEKVNAAMGTFSKRLGELRGGTGELRSILKQTNPVLLEQLENARDSAEAFEFLVLAMRDLANESDRNALSAAAFSKANQAMAFFAGRSADEIRRLKDEGRRLRGPLAETAGFLAEGFNDALYRVNQAMKGVRDAIVVDLMPAFNPMIDRLAEWVAANRELVASNIADFIRDFAARLQSVDWVKFGAAMQDVFSGMKIIAVSAAKAVNFLAGLNEEADRMLKPFNDAGAATNRFFKDFHEGMQSLGARIRAFFSDGLSRIGDWMREALANIPEMLKTNIADPVDGLIAGISGVMQPVFDGVAERWSVALEKAKAGLEAFKTWFSSNFIQPILILVNKVKAAFEGIGNLVNRARGALGIGGGELEGRKLGGPVNANQPYLVGENGPELYTPGRNGFIQPNSLLKAMAGMGAGGSVSGGARLDVNFKNAPSGTSVRARPQGNLFSDIRLDVGRSMQPA